MVSCKDAQQALRGATEPQPDIITTAREVVLDLLGQRPTIELEHAREPVYERLGITDNGPSAAVASIDLTGGEDRLATLHINEDIRRIRARSAIRIAVAQLMAQGVAIIGTME